jgi:hypothetical protein
VEEQSEKIHFEIDTVLRSTISILIALPGSDDENELNDTPLKLPLPKINIK